MTDQHDPPAELDLDEDLFNFDEVMPDESDPDPAPIDLDEIFAVFQEDADETPEPGSEPEEEEAFVPAAPPAASPRRQAVVEEQRPAAAEPAPAAPPRAPRAADPGVAFHAGDVLDALEAFDADEAAADAGQPAFQPVTRRPATRRRRGASVGSGAPAASPRAVTFLTKGAVVVLIAMTLLNVSIGLVTFTSATGMRSDLEAASREMADAALEIRDKVGAQTDAVKRQYLPVAPPTLDEHPTFDRALADIEAGDHAEARRRINALLAVVDRQPPNLREELEARAAFLLARSYHAEVAAAEDGR